MIRLLALLFVPLTLVHCERSSTNVSQPDGSSPVCNPSGREKAQPDTEVGWPQTSEESIVIYALPSRSEPHPRGHYLAVCKNPVPSFYRGKVDDEIVAKIRQGDLSPTDAEWYEWPPKAGYGYRILGFEWNALKVQSLFDPTRFGYVPMKIQNEIISRESHIDPETGWPSGSVAFRMAKPDLYETGEIVEFTKNGIFKVFVGESKELVTFKPVVFTWHAVEAETLADKDLRLRFQVCHAHADNLDSTAPPAIRVQRVMLHPDSSTEPLD